MQIKTGAHQGYQTVLSAINGMQFSKNQIKSMLHKVSPGFYDRLIIWLSSRSARIVRGARNRQTIGDLIRSGRPFCVDICGKTGFGATLTHTVVLHHFFRLWPNFQGVVSSNPLYLQPRLSNDVLEMFFDRVGTAFVEDCVTIPFRFSCDITLQCPEEGLTLAGAREHFFRHFSVKQRFLNETRAIFDGDFRAAVGVHFRGSDKRLESARVEFETVAKSVEQGMKISACDNLFVATDEMDFLTFMQRRYGRRVRALDCQYLSNGVTGAHYLHGDGFQKGREALVTILALSMCKLCVRGPSYLSAWASILNPDLPVIMFGDRSSLPFPEAEIARNSM